MSDLLSQQDKDDVFAALRDVTDTFFKHSITLVKVVKGFSQTDDESADTEVSHALDCRVTVLEKEEDEPTKVGNRTDTKIEIRFNGEYLNGLSLADSENNADIDVDRDYIKYEGADWKILELDYDDSHFADKNVLVKLTCQLKESIA